MESTDEPIESLESLVNEDGNINNNTLAYESLPI
jgi:hypothetical protein